MKQTAVEWLEEQLSYSDGLGVRYPSHNEMAHLNEYFEQAKEMEKQQQDNYAIEFLEWFDKNCYGRGENSFLLWNNDDEPLTPKEVLEKFKKEKYA